MMKRLIALVLLFCLLIPAALADYRYVYNGDKWDSRLNLREKPTKSAASLGLYYTGVRVQVLEDLGEWCRVRIAMGESERPVEGYMMSSFLVSGFNGVAQMPYGLFNGSRAYVMAYSKSRLHLLYEGGGTGYYSNVNSVFVKPQNAEQMAIERICTAASGAQLKNSAGLTIATLYGGVVLDGMIFAGRTRALAALGDENNEVSGIVNQPQWTWMDNGANCSVQYAIYESDTGLIEVLGRMTDGRTILRIMQSADDDAQIVLTTGFNLNGLVPLTRDGSYFRYTRPLLNQPADNELITRVYKSLSQDQLTALAGCTAKVERLMDPQYRHHMLRVRFVSPQGYTVGIADFDGSIMVWQDGDNG